MKVFFLATGFASVPMGLFVRGASWRRIEFPILSILIERDGELILFDTGIGARIHDEMKPLRYRGNWFFNTFIMRTRFNPLRDPLIRQLPSLGFDPKRVSHVIVSHLHWDHAGGMRDFPHARFIVSKEEWRAATSPFYFMHAYIREQYDQGGELMIQQVSTEPNRPCLIFPSSHDIFGDGMFVLVDLPGHTKGMMGLILTLPSGRRFLFGGDSFYFPENLEWGAPKSRLMKVLAQEYPEADATIVNLHRLSQVEPTLEMVGSHDHRIPGKYQLAPAYYDS